MIRLSDEQWERIRNHFTEEHIADGRPGRKPIPTRRVLEAVLWILNTGAQWHMLPQSYPNYKTVHRRFQSWCHCEVLRQVLTDVANELRDRGVLDEEESFIDATFAMAKAAESALLSKRFYTTKNQIRHKGCRDCDCCVSPAFSSPHRAGGAEREPRFDHRREGGTCGPFACRSATRFVSSSPTACQHTCLSPGFAAGFATPVLTQRGMRAIRAPRTPDFLRSL